MGNTSSLKELLKDNERNKQFQIAYEDIIFDYSHEKIDVKDRDKLIDLYEKKNVKEQFQKMFKGDKINFTEDRAVLHTALRKGDLTDHPEVFEVQMKIKEFTNQVRNGEIKGHSGKKLTNFVSIGIGGSYLGGEFVYQALKDNADYAERTKGYNLRFLANICPIDFKRAFEGLDPETTLIIIISKTFTTRETMMNAESAKHWLVSKYPNTTKNDEASILSKHCIAVSTNKPATTKFGNKRK
jgi:glucose-6-phosphate isomerase